MSQHLEHMDPGRLQLEASTLSFFSSDGLNHAQTSELGRLSPGRGGLPPWASDPEPEAKAEQES